MDGLPRIPGYTAAELIAEGGTAEVFLCEQQSVGRMAAVKVLRTREPEGGRFLPLSEAQRSGAAGFHPNIVPVLDAGHTDDGRPFIAMPFFRRRSLWELTGGDPASLTHKEILQISFDVTSALAWSHGSALIHGDLKPHNVLIADDGRAMVADFGGAVEMHQDVAARWQYTAGWAAPEIANGDVLPSVAADIYGVGAIMFYLLYGLLPYQETDATGRMHRISTLPGRDVLDNVREVPVPLLKLVLSLVDSRPHMRPANASIVAGELETLLSVPWRVAKSVPADDSSAADRTTATNSVSNGGRVVFSMPYSEENRRGAPTSYSSWQSDNAALPPPGASLPRPEDFLTSGPAVSSGDYGAALEIMTGIAAPLLSAAAVAFISVILQAPTLFRLGDIALILLLLATGSLIFSLQAGFHARAMPDLPGLAKIRWINRARHGYNAGIVILGLGVAAAIVPARPSPTRWAAFGVAVAFVLLECLWAAISMIRSRQSAVSQSSESSLDEDWI